LIAITEAELQLSQSASLTLLMIDAISHCFNRLAIWDDWGQPEASGLSHWEISYYLSAEMMRLTLFNNSFRNMAIAIIFLLITYIYWLIDYCECEAELLRMRGQSFCISSEKEMRRPQLSFKECISFPWGQNEYHQSSSSLIIIDYWHWLHWILSFEEWGWPF